jgi:hypothetical protein
MGFMKTRWPCRRPYYLALFGGGATGFILSGWSLRSKNRKLKDKYEKEFKVRRTIPLQSCTFSSYLSYHKEQFCGMIRGRQGGEADGSRRELRRLKAHSSCAFYWSSQAQQKRIDDAIRHMQLQYHEYLEKKHVSILLQYPLDA